MLLQPHNPFLSYASPLLSNIPSLALPPTPNAFRRKTTPTITCSTPLVHNYGTVDFERRHSLKWKTLYKKISLKEKPEMSTAAVLNQFEDKAKALKKSELSRVVKELRKYKRYKLALEVYEWMTNRGERFRFAPSDAAIQLDLIAKVHGVTTAEDFFMQLPETLKDGRIHGALLNTYVRHRMKDKAESLMSTMREKGYTTHALAFNVMMTLHMQRKEYDKVEALVSEMMQKNIDLDVYSYNIWLSCRGSQGSADLMEEVFEQMKLDSSVIPNWSTFSTMTAVYIKMGLIRKAEECLREAESRITGRDRIPFHYLINLCGSIGNRDEIYRVWSRYKSTFPTIPNLGYHAVMSALIRAGDIEGAEQLYEEWLSVRTSYDPRIGNLLMNWYVKEEGGGNGMEKAVGVFEYMVEVGGKPNSSTWEILGEGHIREGRIKEAVSCYKEALSMDGSSWRPKPGNISALINLCDEKGDSESKGTLLQLLGRSKFVKDESYASHIGLSSNKDIDAALVIEDVDVDVDATTNDVVGY